MAISIRFYNYNGLFFTESEVVVQNLHESFSCGSKELAQKENIHLQAFAAERLGNAGLIPGTVVASTGV